MPVTSSPPLPGPGPRSSRARSELLNFCSRSSRARSYSCSLRATRARTPALSACNRATREAWTRTVFPVLHARASMNYTTFFTFSAFPQNPGTGSLNPSFRQLPQPGITRGSQESSRGTNREFLARDDSLCRYIMLNIHLYSEASSRIPSEGQESGDSWAPGRVTGRRNNAKVTESQKQQK